MEQPFVLCGLGRIGWRVLEYLLAGQFPVVVVDTTCAPRDPRLGPARLVRGDCRRPEVLEEAGVRNARGVLVVTSDDLVNISAALAVRHLNPEVRVVVRMVNQNLIARLGTAVANVFALSVADLTGPLLALTAVSGQALGAFRLEGVAGGGWQVSEVTVAPGSPLRGQQVGEAAGRSKALVLAHYPGGGKGRLLLDVDPAARLEAGDRLVLCGEPRLLARLLAGSPDETAPHVLWAGWLRRTGRMVWRTLREVDLPVKICTGVLVGVILLSTLVMHFGVEKYTVADALFRTISLIATGADMHEQDYTSGWQKVYVAGLRIVGAALTAAFTAIVTNYLLRAQLGGALEVRRIPDSGHVIVCGLGNVGFRVVEELLHLGERVVVIERAGDNPLVTTARRMKVPVILGDAAVREVLRQAHAPTARAVVAATTNDLVNLEITLLARELNPQQRVVPCLADAHLAQSLREAANVRLTLSVPMLAAPAFVAALFGDRVQSVFLLDGRLLAVVDLLIQPFDSFLAGQTVRAVAVDYRMLPVAVVSPDGSLRPQPLDVRLEAGCQLLAILRLADLERLFRRQGVAKDWGVDVTEVPPSARPWVARLLRLHNEMDEAAAAAALDRLPVSLARALSRGQAEDLAALLHRERVKAEVRQGNGRAGAG